jgi:hypothetical protein
MTMKRNGATQRWNEMPNDRQVDQLLHPGRFYARPADVVADDLLTVDERRAILASWASDACAVDSNPVLRQPPHASVPVTFDEIMDALTQLDRVKRGSKGSGGAWWPRQRLSARSSAM